MTETQVQELIGQLREGDSEALRTIFECYFADLCRYASLTIKPNEEAEDLVQEVFIDLWNRRQSLNITNLKAYLYQAVKFRCINRIKRKKLQFESIDNDNSHIIQSVSAGSLDKQTIRKEIRNAIKNLPEQNRIVFILSKNFGLTHKEIGEHLGISTKTVENHITAAIKRIRLFLRNNKHAAPLLITFFSKYL